MCKLTHYYNGIISDHSEVCINSRQSSCVSIDTETIVPSVMNVGSWFSSHLTTNINPSSEYLTSSDWLGITCVSSDYGQGTFVDIPSASSASDSQVPIALPLSGNCNSPLRVV